MKFILQNAKNNGMNMLFSYRKLCLFLFFVLNFGILFAQITVSSISELAQTISMSNQIVTMTPGVYNMSDYLTPTIIANNTQADQFGRRAMLRFSGDNNTFDFTGVTINIDTQLLNDLGSTVIEFHLTGNTIIFKGLIVNDIGDSPTLGGGQSFTVSGNNTTVENVTLNMSGSSPYGYGDLLGKGGGSLTAMRKHSGMLIGGLNVSIIGCSIYSTSFGHMFFIQGGRNVLFQDCYAEAVTRTTDEMLAETTGTAFNLGFQAVYPNYDGDKVITPGYTKSLSECGFRTYGSGAGNTTSGVSFVNCKAKNARVGFALEVGAPISLENCETTGCEAGYNVKNVTIENSRGDAVNGPLLYLSGDASVVELFLMPELPKTTLHATATIAGNNHNVTLKKWNDETRLEEHLIILGATRPTGTNPFSPLGISQTAGVVLNNCTEMPIEVLSTANSNKINTTGTIINNGLSNIIDKTNCISDDEDVTTEGLINEVFDLEINSEEADPFYGWNPDLSGVYGFMSIDEANNQLTCTFENYDSGYVRFYWRKLNPSKHKLNSNNYPILAMKGKRPNSYSNFTLNLNNTQGTEVKFKDGVANNGVETLSYAQILEGTTDVYYWNLNAIVPSIETWELSGFNCINTGEVDPISVMNIDYIKTFKDLDELIAYELLLNVSKTSVTEIIIYPNPITDFLKIENVNNGVVTVYDIHGKKILEKIIINNSQKLNTKHLTNGMYFVEIVVNSLKTTRKVVKI